MPRFALPLLFIIVQDATVISEACLKWTYYWCWIYNIKLTKISFIRTLYKVRIHWRMLMILECSQRCHGRTDGRTVAFLYSFTTSLYLKMGDILNYSKKREPPFSNTTKLWRNIETLPSVRPSVTSLWTL
jgi:hypothetical protein